MGVRTPLKWTIVGHVPGELSECQAAHHGDTFHANLTPEMQAGELLPKTWDEDVMGI